MYWAFIYVSVHQSLHRVQLCITPWTIALQIPLFLEFSRKEYQSGFPFPFPGDLPNSGIKPRSPELQTWNLQADSLPSEPPGKPKVCVSHFSPVSLFVTPWTIAVQAPLSMEQSRQEYWSGLPFPPSDDLLDSRIKPGSFILQGESLLSELPRKPKVCVCHV